MMSYIVILKVRKFQQPTANRFGTAKEKTFGGGGGAHFAGIQESMEYSMENFWSTFGALLEYFWGTFGVLLEYFLGNFGVLLEYFWSTFEVLFGFGVLLEYCWNTLRLHGMIL